MEQIKINGILWDTKNLEIDGEKYFQWQEAMSVAKILGKRLPAREEFQALIDSGWEFDQEKKGMWFADRKLFIPLSGYQYDTSGALSCTVYGYLWSSSPKDDSYSWTLGFTDGAANMYSSSTTYGFPVRCVQDIKSDNSTIKENKMEKSNSQWKDAFFTPPADMQIVFVKTKCNRLLAGMGVGYKLPGRMAFEVEDEIISYDSNDVDYYDVFWTEVPK